MEHSPDCALWTTGQYGCSCKGGRDYNAEAAALPKHDFDLRMHAYMLDTFRPWMDGVSALELGCFQGHFTRCLQEYYPDVTVVEASERCIKEAGEATRQVAFVHGTFETVALECRYDAIFAIHVLEHLDDPVAVLKRCRDWLLPEGRLFVAVPNGHAASRQIAAFMGLVPYPQAVTPAEAAHGHKRTYVAKTLTEHVTQAGFHEVWSGGIFFKALSGAQYDLALRTGTISDQYMDACYRLGPHHPELCASIYAVCEL